MARIIYAHPSRRGYPLHVFTDLDFWDARKIFRDKLGLLSVRRNFGKDPDGDIYPTQIVSDERSQRLKNLVEKRLRKAVVAPPRHVVVREMIMNGSFRFRPYDYFPDRWSKSLIERVMRFRLPLEQSALSTPYYTVELVWEGDELVVRRIHREKKHDPVIRTPEEARKYRIIPSGF
ncbi:hypothetical protein [Thermodesulforhabdus norvegica]|uniref:Uncharacterized protein n=1 Tax=Thermodesulforhabdus norvegica TaxID=39841 RepID=A0A1I4QLL2_9BACT|nr:hypothetical protein [Thermodesulforhabdus norvegica]SFM40931.1 hypothetical protein SAMN05660836_00102 [Thermodesulforhabdus norvegica]